MKEAAPVIDELDEPNPLSLRTCAETIARGDKSAEEITRAALRRIDALNPVLNAMVHVDRRGALDSAAEIDRRRDAGLPLGPLAGVPLTIKDLISVADMPLSAGSKILQGYLSPYDATVTARLRAAGAIVLGKTNLDEFGMGSTGERSWAGPTRNPWDPARVPGGSSSGSAAAVAAGMGLGSLGTDTGGSVRLPASLCGLVALKPTWGRVSRHGVIAFASSLDQVGPIGRSIPDVARLLSVIAGPCDRDSTCSASPVPNYEANLDAPVRGLRVGVPRQHLAEARGLDPEVAARVEEALERLQALGTTIVDVDLPLTTHSVATYYLIAAVEASSNLSRYDGLRFGRRAALREKETVDALYTRSRGEGFGAEVKRRILLGTFALSSEQVGAWYDRACRVRRLLHDELLRALSQCDVLAGPVSPQTAWRIGEHLQDPLSLYLLDIFTVGPSLAGLPALSVPAGLDKSGLPVGLQLVGRPFDEATILRLGHALLRVSNHNRLQPNLSALLKTQAAS